MFALISEIPWNFVHNGTALYYRQNVYFTLFFGYLAIVCYEYFKENRVFQIASVLLIFVFSMYFGADYRGSGVALIFIMILR